MKAASYLKSIVMVTQMGCHWTSRLFPLEYGKNDSTQHMRRENSYSQTLAHTIILIIKEMKYLSDSFSRDLAEVMGCAYLSPGHAISQLPAGGKILVNS